VAEACECETVFWDGWENPRAEITLEKCTVRICLSHENSRMTSFVLGSVIELCIISNVEGMLQVFVGTWNFETPACGGSEEMMT
jgi:hypothetical protein